jgi:hypothetical protein
MFGNPPSSSYLLKNKYLPSGVILGHVSLKLEFTALPRFIGFVHAPSFFLKQT